MNKKLILAGGIINLIMAIFHLLFPWLFNWKETLTCLTFDDRSLMYALSFHCTLMIFGFAGISLFLREELLKTKIGKAIMAIIALFYTLRAGEQWVLFKDPLPIALFFFFLCLGIAALYAIPLYRTRGES